MTRTYGSIHFIYDKSLKIYDIPIPMTPAKLQCKNGEAKLVVMGCTGVELGLQGSHRTDITMLLSNSFHVNCTVTVMLCI